MRKIKFNGEEFTLKINIIGLFFALLLIGLLAFYINGNRDYVKKV